MLQNLSFSKWVCVSVYSLMYYISTYPLHARDLCVGHHLIGLHHGRHRFVCLPRGPVYRLTPLHARDLCVGHHLISLHHGRHGFVCLPRGPVYRLTPLHAWDLCVGHHLVSLHHGWHGFVCLSRGPVYRLTPLHARDLCVGHHLVSLHHRRHGFVCLSRGPVYRLDPQRPLVFILRRQGDVVPLLHRVEEKLPSFQLWGWKLGDNTFVIEWFAGINCIILQLQISFTATWVAKGVMSLLLSWHKCYDFNAANFRRHGQWKCALPALWIRINIYWVTFPCLGSLVYRKLCCKTLIFSCVTLFLHRCHHKFSVRRH